MTIQECIDKWKHALETWDTYKWETTDKGTLVEGFIKDLEEIQKEQGRLWTTVGPPEPCNDKELLESYKKVTGKDPEWKWVKDPLPPQPPTTAP